MAIVNEVVTKFSFAGNLSPLQRFNSGLDGIIAGLAGVAAATAGAAVAVAGFTKSVAASVDPTIQLSRATGVAVETLQELQFAAATNGSSVESLNASIERFSIRIGEAAKSGNEDFQRLGISIRNASGDVKSTDELLQDVQKSFARLSLSQAEKIGFAERLGIDPSLVQLLSLTEEQLAATRQEAERIGVFSTEQGNALASLTDEFTRVGFAIDTLKVDIAAGLAPVIRGIADDFKNFLADNRELIVKGISFVTKGIIALSESFVRLAPVLGVVAAGFVTLKIATLGFAGALGVLASPIVITTGFIAGIVLSLDDLIVALSGGESAIASFFSSIVTGALDFIIEGIESIREATADLADDIANFLGKDVTGVISSVISNIGNAIKSITNAIFSALSGVATRIVNTFTSITGRLAGFFEAPIGTIKGIFLDLTGFITGVFLDVINSVVGIFDDGFVKIGQGISEIFTDIVNFFKGIFSDLILGIADAANTIGVISDEELQNLQKTFEVSVNKYADQGVSNTVNNANVNQNVTINVQGSNANEIASNVTNNLNSQLLDTQNQFRFGAL
jgi:phage-related protein